jgi:hypothetical protein
MDLTGAGGPGFFDQETLPPLRGGLELDRGDATYRPWTQRAAKSRARKLSDVT